MPSLSYRMPSCNGRDCQKIADAIAAMRGDSRRNASALFDELGARDLCIVLHAMRRWYTYNCWNAAKKIVQHSRALRHAMDLSLPIGAYRGFKVGRESDLHDVEEGDRFRLLVERNGGCSSWTLNRGKANLFSGATRDKIGIVVRLRGGRNAHSFIAPPSRSAAWFNTLYERTMGSSFRFKEQEYAIYGRYLDVEAVAVKRR